METSEHLDKLAPALAKAQSEMSGAVKDSTNPFFKAKYASLSSVWQACKDALHNNGFSVVQSPVSSDGRIGVTTILLHASGQYVKDSYTLSVKKQGDPQADGSSITYARRYALAAFVGVCPVDDDAESAMDRSKKQKPEAKQVFHIPEEFQANYDILLEQLNSYGVYDMALEWMKDNSESFVEMLGGKGSPALDTFRNYSSKYLASLKEKK